MDTARYCAACGFPLKGPRCVACGREVAKPVPQHAPKAAARTLAPQPADFPELKAAFDAWGQRDFPRMISECLAVAGLRVTTPQILPRGSGWLFNTKATVVFLLLDSKKELSLESPLVLVPSEQVTPLFRSLLELNEHALGAARFCLRTDRVVLKFADQVDNVSPPKLMSALREVAGASDHFAQLLSHRFKAPLVAPEMRKPGVDPWQWLGTPASLSVGSAPAPAQAIGGKQDIADMVGDLSAGTFRYPDVTSAEEDELELARDPYAGRENPAGPMLHKLQQALAAAVRVGVADGGVFGLLLYRAVALWARALAPPGPGQETAAFLLLTLGEWALRLPELPLKPGPNRPAPPEVRAAVEGVVKNDGLMDARWAGKVYPVPPFKAADEPRAQVRKFMALMTRCPKDDEARGLLLEGALAEQLMRAPRLAPDAENRIVELLMLHAPPSPMRVHELQNALTRTWP